MKRKVIVLEMSSVWIYLILISHNLKEVGSAFQFPLTGNAFQFFLRGF